MKLNLNLRVIGLIAGLGLSPLGARATSVGDVNRLEVLQRYQQTNVSDALRGSIATLPKQEQRGLTDVLNGIYFVDYKHAAADLMSAFIGEKKFAELTFQKRYDQIDNSFEKFGWGRQVIANHSGALSMELLREIHRVAIGVDLNKTRGTKVTSAGEIRQRLVYGPEFEVGLSRPAIDAINASPYVFFLPSTSIYADVPKGTNQATHGTNLRGAIVYPRPRDIKLEALAFIRQAQPDLYKRIQDYQLESRALEQQGRASLSWKNRDPQLTQDLITALLSERIQRFERDQSQLGEVNSAAKIQTYVRMIAQFQKDYISIHPFPDGNGRTSRLILMHLAARKGLPIPRIANPNDDLYSTVDQWATQIRDGMVATAQLEFDLPRRISQGLPLERSVEMLSPLLAQDRGALTSMAVTYQNYILQRFTLEKSVLQPMFASDPVGTMRTVLSQYGQQGQTNLDTVPAGQASGF